SANGTLPPSWAINSAGGTIDLGAIPTENLAIKNTDTPKGYQFEFFLPWQKLLAAENNTTTKITAGQKNGWVLFAHNSLNGHPPHQDVAMDRAKRPGPSGNPSKGVTTVLEPAPAPPTAGP